MIITDMNVGFRYFLNGRDDEAIRITRKTIDIANATNHPDQIGSALTVVARAELARGQLDEALAAAHEASQSLERFADATVSRRVQYALALIREAEILAHPNRVNLGRPADAIPLLQRAFQMTDDVAARDPGESTSRLQLPLSGSLLARLIRDSDPARALAICDRVLQREGELKNNTVARLAEVSALADSSYPLRARHRLADAEAARGNIAHAIEIYQMLLDQVFATSPKPETDLADATDLSRLFASFAALDRRAGLTAEATTLDTRRRQMWHRWEQTLPGNAFVARQLADLQPSH